MSHNKARTPFDDLSHSGADVPLSKSTQPLPSKGSLLSGLQNGSPSGFPTGNSATPSPQPTAPTPAAPPPQPAPKANRPQLPLPTVIGLAVTGGVLLATVLPMLVSRAIPTVAVNAYPTPAATPIVPGQAPEPPLLVPKDEAAQESAPAAPEPASPDADIPAEPAPQAPSIAAAPAEEATPTPEPRRRPRPSRGEESERNPAPQVLEGRFAIDAPSGWSRRRSGRQVIWSGPRGARLLVEESGDIGPSPRADWEKMDRAFARSYGPRYRSLGIRDATLAGRPAAVWEFELTSKSGQVTRKIDVAIHDSGRGFAVLGSAPTERWDDARPEIESAIATFTLAPERRDFASGDSRDSRISAPESAPEESEENERGF